MATYFVGSRPAAGSPGEVHTTKLNDIGAENLGSDGLTYVYLEGVNSTVVGSWVTFDVAGQTALLAANAIGPVAIATAAVLASQYGWYVRDTGASSCSAYITASSLAVGNIGYETTAGYAGDGRAAGDQINGAVGAANAGASALTAGVRIFHPYVDDSSGS